MHAWALDVSGLWWVWVCENMWVYVRVWPQQEQFRTNSFFHLEQPNLEFTVNLLILWYAKSLTANLWSGIHCQSLIYNSPPVSDLKFTTNLRSGIHCQALIYNSLPFSDLEFTANLSSAIHWSVIHCRSLICIFTHCQSLIWNLLPISDKQFAGSLSFAIHCQSQQQKPDIIHIGAQEAS